MRMHMFVSGRRIQLDALEPDDINIDDIAHNLTILPRFVGNTSRPISVAEHSVLVMQLVEENGGTPLEMLQALLHDATEAYIGDIPTPVKEAVPELRDFEQDYLWPIIAKRFEIPEELEPRVKTADRVAFFIEAKSLCFANDIEDWAEHDKYGPVAEAWMEAHGSLNPSEMPHPAVTHRVFLTCFRTLLAALEEDTPAKPDIRIVN